MDALLQAYLKASGTGLELVDFDFRVVAARPSTRPEEFLHNLVLQ